MLLVIILSGGMRPGGLLSITVLFLFICWVFVVGGRISWTTCLFKPDNFRFLARQHAAQTTAVMMKRKQRTLTSTVVSTTVKKAERSSFASSKSIWASTTSAISFFVAGTVVEVIFGVLEMGASHPLHVLSHCSTKPLHKPLAAMPWH